MEQQCDSFEVNKFHLPAHFIARSDQDIEQVFRLNGQVERRSASPLQ